VFTNLSSGQNVYSSASKTGYVSVDGTDTVEDTGSGVIANAVVKSTLQLGLPGELVATMGLPAGAVMPVSYSTTTFAPYVTSTLWPSISSRRNPPDCATASPAQVCQTAASTTATQIGRLFPAAYGVWFGGCQDAQPATVTLATVDSGITATTVADVGAVAVSAADLGGVGRTVVARHAADASCTSGDLVQLTALAPVGLSTTVALPPGNWTVSFDDGTGSQPVTVTGGSVSTVTVG
jgi:hypothetical protein